MKILDGGLAEWGVLNTPSTVTLGVFDGVHTGHRSLIARAFEHPGLRVVVTFDPHPVEVLAPGTPPRLITTLEERIALLEEVGTEVVAVLDLGEIRHLSPETFVNDVLVDRLSIRSLSIGEDFHFGRDRAGDVEFLRDCGARRGFEVDVVDLLQTGSSVVSSSRIRDMIESGSVGEATALLGHRFTLTNTVIPGDKRGRAIGFPTANLEPPERKVLPADGVYAAFARVDGVAHLAATNVGTRPTFGGGQRLVEAFLLDFDDDLYGSPVTVEFVERLRPELDFDDVGELVDQMHIDVENSREILATVMG